MSDAFRFDPAALHRAVDLLQTRFTPGLDPAATLALGPTLPEVGSGDHAALEVLAPAVLGAARSLGAPRLLRPHGPADTVDHLGHCSCGPRAATRTCCSDSDTAPVARDIEAAVVGWLAPWFGMTGGHMTPGSTVANLTALWAAREAGTETVVATAAAHVSIAKAAHLLAMRFQIVEDWNDPGDLANCVAVITAGATSTGEIEALDAAQTARWRHVDAAWAGPFLPRGAQRRPPRQSRGLRCFVAGDLVGVRAPAHRGVDRSHDAADRSARLVDAVVAAGRHLH